MSPFRWINAKPSSMSIMRLSKTSVSSLKSEVANLISKWFIHTHVDSSHINIKTCDQRPMANGL